MKKNLINKAVVIAQAIMLIAFTANVFAADNLLDKIIERGELRVGTTGDYKPFSYHITQHNDKKRSEDVNKNIPEDDDNPSKFKQRIAMIGVAGDFKPGSFVKWCGRNPLMRQHDKNGYIGFDIEMAQNLADRIGVKLKIVPTTWSTLSQDLKDEKYDIAMAGVSVNLERQKIGFYSMPYLRDGKTPITLCTNKDRFQTLEQIDQPTTTTIVNPGGTNQKFANENLKQANVKVHPDNVTIFTQIIEGKADLMITDAVETRLQAKIHPELCALHPEKPFDFSEKAYLMPRDLVFQQFVNQWLRQMIESGEFDLRFNKWINYSWQAADKE